MSRIGKKTIILQKGVLVSVDEGNSIVKVKGTKGELSCKIDESVKIIIDKETLLVNRVSDQRRHRALHGLYRSIINNMVIGVTNGYKVQMEVVGVGFKATHQNNLLELSLGYSHTIFMSLPQEVKVFTETLKGKNPIITLECIDKQLLGQVAAKIKSLRPAEPYKEKGIKFVGEIIRRKAGKTASKK